EVGRPAEALRQIAVQRVGDRRNAEQHQDQRLPALEHGRDQRRDQRDPGEAEDVRDMAHGGERATKVLYNSAKPLPDVPCSPPEASPTATPASTSTRATHWSTASSPASGARSGPKCSPASAASAPLCPCRRSTASRCWFPAPTAWAPSSGWPSTPGGTNASASIWWPCASTTWPCRAPSRCSSSITTPPASSRWMWPRRWWPALPRAAC